VIEKHGTYNFWGAGYKTGIKAVFSTLAIVTEVKP
jgi:hypothetical protein